MTQAIAPITDKLADGYWLGFSMAKMLMHARFFDTLLKARHNPETDTASKIRVNPRRNVTELWVLTRNRTGLFRDLTLAISASGASITGARLNTGKDGLVRSFENDLTFGGAGENRRLIHAARYEIKARRSYTSESQGSVSKNRNR